MIRVKNQKLINRLCIKSLFANRTRNLIAAAAIALTAMLFTALFTIAMTLANTFEQQAARQIGGNMSGSFKNVTLEQLDELKNDPLIKEYGTRLVLGMPTDVPFNKAHVEVSYMDDINAKGSFCVPEQGRLPAEGTMEIACDTRILQLLGVTPQLGAEVNIPCRLTDGTTFTDTFTLAGWWTYDEAGIASHALVPRSYVEQRLAGYKQSIGDTTGTWTLNVNLKSNANIEQTLRTILTNHGYQCDDQGASNYIGIGVSWAALSTALNSNADPITILMLAVLLAVIVLTGYLIIYNVFQISISNDIRFYGLLKTIGTTPRQLRSLVRRQALALSVIGIPPGLALGYALGLGLAPATLNMLSYSQLYTSSNPLIFVGSSLFALVTVLISCAKPGRIAGSVSPIEAVRYTEGSGSIKKSTRQASNGGSPLGMALANLGRNTKKTVLVVISLSLSVVLMQATYSLASGFDMDKFLHNFVETDFVLADAGYFRSRSLYTFTQEDVAAVESTGLVEQGEAITSYNNLCCFVPEDFYINLFAGSLPEETIRQAMETEQRDGQGNVSCAADMLGMSDFVLGRLEVLEGDISALRDPSQNAIAAVYTKDENGVVSSRWHYAKLGDTLTLRYVDEWEYFRTDTGKALCDEELDTVDPDKINRRPKTWHDAEYTVAALVSIPNPLGFRFSGRPQFVLNADVLTHDSASQPLLMSYVFDTTDQDDPAMEAFLKDYTENLMPNLDYESKASYHQQFAGLHNMFLLLGGVLSAVVAVVGVLNFLNAILTSIFSRRREFAVLQSIGMTGKQLNQMLVYEGLFYAVWAGAVSLVGSILIGWAMQAVVAKVLWFYTYHFTLLPLLVTLPLFAFLGASLPLIAYHFTARQSIVERLRQSE